MIIPILTVTAGLVLAIKMSAFKGEPKMESKPFDTFYFQFSGSNIEARHYSLQGFVDSLDFLPSGTILLIGHDNIN